MTTQEYIDNGGKVTILPTRKARNSTTFGGRNKVRGGIATADRKRKANDIIVGIITRKENLRPPTK